MSFVLVFNLITLRKSRSVKIGIIFLSKIKKKEETKSSFFIFFILSSNGLVYHKSKVQFVVDEHTGYQKLR